MFVVNTDIVLLCVRVEMKHIDEDNYFPSRNEIIFSIDTIPHTHTHTRDINTKNVE